MKRLILVILIFLGSTAILISRAAWSAASAPSVSASASASEAEPASPTSKSLGRGYEVLGVWTPRSDGEAARKIVKNLERSDSDLENYRLGSSIVLGGYFKGTNLKGAKFNKTAGYAFHFENSDLTGAEFKSVILSSEGVKDILGDDYKTPDGRPIPWGLGADFSGANLTNATFFASDLRGANFFDSDMTGVKMWSTNLEDVIFEPAVLPPAKALRSASGLDRLDFRSADKLIQMRQRLKEAGNTLGAKEITHSIRYRERLRADWPERIITYWLFEITCEWGASASRPFAVIAVLIFVFAIPYGFSIARGGISKAGIWVVADPASLLPTRIGAPFKLKPKAIGYRDPSQLVFADGRTIFLWALLFSLLSATQIGWRDLQIAGLLERMNPSDFVLRPKGWVKTVSGLQSVLSVFLLALALLSYFAAPFE